MHPIDKHSKILITRNIELLLDYCMRFYERQFVPRSKVNKDVLMKFEDLPDVYFQSDKPQLQGLPIVKYFADGVNLSSNYFGDFVKKETNIRNILSGYSRRMSGSRLQNTGNFRYKSNYGAGWLYRSFFILNSNFRTVLSFIIVLRCKICKWGKYICNWGCGKKKIIL